MDPNTEWEYCDVPYCGVTEIAVNSGEHSVIFHLNCYCDRNRIMSNTGILDSSFKTIITVDYTF